MSELEVLQATVDHATIESESLIKRNEEISSKVSKEDSELAQIKGYINVISPNEFQKLPCMT